jgi:hypothetical protein
MWEKLKEKNDTQTKKQVMKIICGQDSEPVCCSRSDSAVQLFRQGAA